MIVPLRYVGGFVQLKDERHSSMRAKLGVMLASVSFS